MQPFVFWKQLSHQAKEDVLVKIYVYFPEIFGESPDRFDRTLVWLAEHGVLCPNPEILAPRRPFVAVDFDRQSYPLHCYSRIPAYCKKIVAMSSQIKKCLESASVSELMFFWQSRHAILDPINEWAHLASQSASEIWPLPRPCRDFFADWERY